MVNKIMTPGELEKKRCEMNTPLVNEAINAINNKMMLTNNNIIYITGIKHRYSSVWKIIESHLQDAGWDVRTESDYRETWTTIRKVGS